MALCLIYFAAGLNFTASGDRAVGDALTATEGDPTAHRVALLIGGPVLIWVLAKHRTLLLRTLRDNVVLCLLLGWALLSTFWSQNPLQTMPDACTLTGTALLAIWMARTIPWDEQVKIILYAGAVAGIASVLVSVAMPSRGIDYEHGGAWQGIFYSKNHLGRMMLFFLTPVFYQGAGQQHIFKRWMVRYGYIALCLGLIAMSRSKTALPLVPVWLLLCWGMFLARKIRARDRALLLIIASVFFGVAAALVLPNLSAIVLSFGGDPTLTGRTVIWQELLVSIAKRPWTGYGYGAFWGQGEGWDAFMRVYGAMHFTAAYAHSGYIDVLLQLGIVGLALVMALMLKSLLMGLRLFGDVEPERVEWSCGILLLTLIYNADEVIYLASKAWPWFALLLAFFNLYAVQQARQELRTPSAAGVLQETHA